MPQVKFLGPVSNTDGTQSVQADGAGEVVLQEGAEKPTEVTEKQLKAILELPGLRFEVDGEEKVTEPVQTPEPQSAEAETPEPDSDEAETSEPAAETPAGDDSEKKSKSGLGRAKKD